VAYAHFDADMSANARASIRALDLDEPRSVTRASVDLMFAGAVLDALRQSKS
jgi:hypothetical protein